MILTLLAPLAGACSVAVSVPPGEPEVGELKFKPAKKWTLILPNETWTKVEGGIPIPHKNGSKFVAYGDGLKLALDVDTNGDGRPDETVKGAKGFALLRGDAKDGGHVEYAARFRSAGKTDYEFAASGYMEGVVAGELVRLIDQNNNGRYDEVGVDAMALGRSSSASFLSSVVHLKGELYNIDVSPDGSRIEARPFTGETGTLDLRAGYKGRGKVEALVVSSGDGKLSFELSDERSGLVVPVGEYRISGGFLKLGGESVRVKPGKMRPVRVELGREAGAEWGSPVIGEFRISHSGETVKIEPNDLKLYGNAGEEYVDFLPQGASPKFLVFDKETEKLLKAGRFGGC